MFNAVKTSLVLTLICLLHATKSADLPSSVTPCKRNDPKLNQCILREAKKWQSEFTDGIPELGVDSMNPFHCGNYSLDMGRKGFAISFYNGYIYGFKNSKIISTKFNMAKKTFIIELSSKTKTVTDYVANGRLMQIPINGHGKFMMWLTGLDTKYIMKWELVKGTDGLQYINITNIKTPYTIQNARFQISGLLSKEIDATMNVILNQNWRTMEPEVGPQTISKMTLKLSRFFNNFFAKISFDKLFPL